MNDISGKSTTPLRIVLFGTGRSGTTAMYTLLQEMLLSRFDGAVEFGYEPFLRKKSAFDGRYDDVKENAPYIDSLSFEGIYNHLQLPLFIDNPVPYEDNRFLGETLQPRDNENHLLVKFIRVNGRYRLLERLAPGNKFIFITRNPVDVVHSIIRRFSFYGGEFHTDDYPRFIDSIKRLYPQTCDTVSMDKADTVDRKELLYWYYMNRFALESITNSGKNVLVICYEAYVKKREYHIKRICDFLGLDFRPEYGDTARKPVGSITRNFEMSKEVIEIYREYLKGYFRMLADFEVDMQGIDHWINGMSDEIIGKYRLTDNPPSTARPDYGLHGRAIVMKYRQLLNKKDQQLAEKEQIIKELESRK